jgi:hypothetical protein
MFLKIWIARRRDARHTKTRAMAEMKLQQAAAKSLSKNEARWIAVNIVKLSEPTLGRVRAMSGLPPKADMVHRGRNVRFVPKGEMHRCWDKGDMAGGGQGWRDKPH